MGSVAGLMVECLNGREGCVLCDYNFTLAIQACLHVTIIEETMCDFVLFFCLERYSQISPVGLLKVPSSVTTPLSPVRIFPGQ